MKEQSGAIGLTRVMNSGFELIFEWSVLMMNPTSLTKVTNDWFNYKIEGMVR